MISYEYICELFLKVHVLSRNQWATDRVGRSESIKRQTNILLMSGEKMWEWDYVTFIEELTSRQSV